jgi:hypothetical protein
MQFKLLNVNLNIRFIKYFDFIYEYSYKYFDHYILKKQCIFIMKTDLFIISKKQINI